MSQDNHSEGKRTKVVSRKRVCFSVTSKSKNTLKMPPRLTAVDQAEVDESIKFAFFCKELAYTKSLVFDDGKVPANDAMKEPNL